MRAGVSSAGRWWVSMGPVGWLVLLPVAAAWAVLVALWWLGAGIIALARAARSPRASSGRT